MFLLSSQCQHCKKNGLYLLPLHPWPILILLADFCPRHFRLRKLPTSSSMALSFWNYCLASPGPITLYQGSTNCRWLLIPLSPEYRDASYLCPWSSLFAHSSRAALMSIKTRAYKQAVQSFRPQLPDLLFFLFKCLTGTTISTWPIDLPFHDKSFLLILTNPSLLI